MHGDSHYFKMDKPINAAEGGVVANFTRVETFGSRNTHWVSATIIPSAEPVRVEPRSSRPTLTTSASAPNDTAGGAPLPPAGLASLWRRLPPPRGNQSYESPNTT